MSNIIDCLRERGLIDAMTSEDLPKLLEQPLKVYLGFDPTADSLHIGSLVGIVILRWFQKYGHTPVIIVGGATARIGDPSGKSVERPLLDTAAIDYNVARIKRHFDAVLDFFHPKARPVLLNNDEWLSKFSLVDFLRDIGKHFRVGPMLAKEMVKSRINSEEGISFTEFSYQLLQSYDFYHLNTHHGVQLQLGGAINGGISLPALNWSENSLPMRFLASRSLCSREATERSLARRKRGRFGLQQIVARLTSSINILSECPTQT